MSDYQKHIHVFISIKPSPKYIHNILIINQLSCIKFCKDFADFVYWYANTGGSY